jgi:outer membrane protein assembly factor BamA
LIFSDIGSLTKTSEKLPLPSESALAIMRIIIEGNDKISEKEITDALNMKNGDLADVDVLSSAKLHLESLGWFQNIGMELIQNDKGVDLVVKITEKEIISPVAVVVEGATVFTKDELVKYFNLTPSMTTIQDVAMKCKLINELYKVKDYEMASAKYSVVSNTLHINIDEGRIDGIEVHGNNKIISH